MYKKFVFIAIVLFTIVSCEKSFVPGATKSKDVANEWWADLYVDGAAYYGTPSKIMTYNTVADNDSIWVDDGGNLWDFKVKAKFDAKALTFQTTDAQNENYDITVTITDGKIMPKAAKSTTGVVTDSIYFKVVFSDDPTNTYEIRGTGRTMWAEDDH